MNVKIKLLRTIDNIEFWLIDDLLLQKIDSKWKDYIGCHHWGKGKTVVIDDILYEGTSYIPENEIWISNYIFRTKKGSSLTQELCRVMKHEYLERQLMQYLVDYEKLSRDKAWYIAHHSVKNVEKCRIEDYDKFIEKEYNYLDNKRQRSIKIKW